MATDPDQSRVTERQDEQHLKDSLQLSRGASSVVPGYELTEKLGRGAFGEVWKARQASTDKDVAIKIFFRFHGLDWRFLRREVERLVALDSHPGIVSLLDTHLDLDPPSYVMELVAGGSMGAALRRDTGVPVDQAASP